MSGLFGDSPFGGAFAAIFGGSALPPESVPLRILGLDARPATQDAVKAAFRRRVRLAHPDLHEYMAEPSLRKAAEALAADMPDVQELVWARDVMLQLIPVTDNKADRGRVHQPSRCKGCGEPETSDRRTHLGWRGRWDGYCCACKSAARNTELRLARSRAREGRICHACGEPFAPPRAGARFCSAACRQRAYRRRRKADAS